MKRARADLEEWMKCAKEGPEWETFIRAEKGGEKKKKEVEKRIHNLRETVLPDSIEPEEMAKVMSDPELWSDLAKAVLKVECPTEERRKEVRRMEEDEKGEECEICARRFVNKKALRIHKTKIHAKDALGNVIPDKRWDGKRVREMAARRKEETDKIVSRFCLLCDKVCKSVAACKVHYTAKHFVRKPGEKGG